MPPPPGWSMVAAQIHLCTESHTRRVTGDGAHAGDGAHRMGAVRAGIVGELGVVHGVEKHSAAGSDRPRQREARALWAPSTPVSTLHTRVPASV